MEKKEENEGLKQRNNNTNKEMNEPGIKTRSYCRYSAETFPEIARVPKRKPGCKNKGKRRLFIFLGRKEEVQQEINLMSFVFLG